MNPTPILFDELPKHARSSLGRVFIYVLYLNDKKHPEKIIPFHIGTTSQLAKRLGNHAKVNWHEKIFRSKPTVSIIGSCDIDNTVSAVAQLTQSFKAQGYSLSTPSSITSSEDERLAQYYETFSASPTIPDEWVKRWGIKTGGRKKNQSLGVTEELVKLSKDDFIAYVTSTFKGSNLVLFKQLAEHYSPENSGVILDVEDPLLVDVNGNPKRNKVFAYPARNYSYGKRLLVLQKSVVDKMVRNK